MKVNDTALLLVLFALLMIGCSKIPKKETNGKTITITNNTDVPRTVTVMTIGGKEVKLKINPKESADYVPDPIPTYNEEELPETRPETGKGRM